MTRNEHLLTILAEECNEVAHRVSKILRFGMKDIQKDQELDNEQRLMMEVIDLFSIVEILHEEKIIDLENLGIDLNKHSQGKIERVKKYLEYSKSVGTLTE